MAQWTQFGNPKGKGIEQLVFPTPSVGYATTTDDLIIKTTDGGATWSTVYQAGRITGIDVYIFKGLVFTDANTGYAFGFDFLGANYLILKTSNGGATWQPFTAQYNLEIGECTAADFPTAQTGFVVGEWGIAFKTSNSGASWQKVNLNTKEELLDVDFVNANEGFVVDNGGKMYKTTNGGAAWSTINLTTTFSKIQFLNAQSGFAVSARSVYKTTNGGATWQLTGDTLNDPIQAIYFFDAQNGYLLANSRIWKTTNGGQKWHLQENKATFGANQAAEINGFYFIDANTAFAGGAFYGTGTTTPLLLKTTNGGGIGINFTLSQQDLRCPYPSVLTAQPSIIGAFSAMEWRLDSTVIGSSIGTQNIPIPNPSTTGYHKVFFKVKNGLNQVEIMRDFTIEVPQDFSGVELTAPQNPCKGEAFRLYTTFRSLTDKVQVVANGRIVASPKIISSWDASQNYFDVPAIAAATTYKIQILSPCGIKDGKPMTVTPFDLPDKTLSVATTSPQLLCGDNHLADIVAARTQNQITYTLYQDGLKIGNDQIGNGGNLVFKSDVFNNTTKFAILATTPNHCSQLLDDTVQIQVEHPVADFTINGLNVLAGTPISVAFAGQEAVQYQWTFGMNASIASSTLAQPPTFTYTNTDSATIKLIIKALLGCRDTISRKIGFYKTTQLPRTWGQVADISNQNFIKGQDISVDNANNIVLTGTCTEGGLLPSKAGMKGVQDFDGTTILKYDPFGVLLWHTSIENVGGGFSRITATEHDKDNNIITAVNLSSYGDKTVFHSTDRKKKTITDHDEPVIAKYTSDGRLLWLVQMTGCAILHVNDIETDVNGNIFVLVKGFNIWRCQYKFSVISADNTIQEVTNVHNNCLVKISPTGQFLWAKPLSTSDNDIWIDALKLRVNSQGQIFVSGGYYSMLIKFDANGNILWQVKQQATSTGIAIASDLVQDSVGNTYIGGSFQNTLVVQGLPSVTSTSGTLSPYNLFLLKIDVNGKPLWLKAGITEGYSENTALQFYKGSLYVSSFFVNNFKYDTATIKAKSLLSAFILKVREQDGRYQAHYLLDKPKPNGEETRYQTTGNTLRISKEGYFHWIGELGYSAKFGNDSLNRPQSLFIAKFNPFGTVTAVETPVNLAPLNALLFPNPSEKQSVLRLSLEESTEANISIFDVLGKEQALFLNKKLEKGVTDLPISVATAGVYWVVVKTKEGREKVLKWFSFR